MNQNVLTLKQEIVSEISNKIKNSDSTVIVEYRGLTVAEISELRRKLRSEEVEMKVYKNTMSQRAVNECGFEGLNEFLVGPNALTFSKDETASARVLAKFAKDHENLILKAGIVKGKVVGIDVINELSLLPNHDGMISMLLSCLQSPISSFARVVKAVADNKESNSPIDSNITESKEETKPSEETKPVEDTKPIEEVKTNDDATKEVVNEAEENKA